MTFRRIIVVLTALSLGLAVAGCGKKPRDLDSPPGSPKFPTQYPTSR